MSIKKIKNYFDPRENLSLNRRDEDEDEMTFEEARNAGAQRVQAERSRSTSAVSSPSPRSIAPTGTRTTGMGLMTELQKNNLSFDDARQIGMRNHALDYQKEIRERALEMREEAKNIKSPYEALAQEDKSSLARLYSLQNQLNTFSTYNQTNPNGGNPLLQTQNPYNSEIQQEYNTLYADLNKKGHDVTELMRHYERVKNGEAAEDIKKTLAEKTTEHPALMSAASVGLNLLTAQNSVPKAVKDAIYDKAYGTLGVDTNAPEFFGTYATNAIREKASTDIVKKTREKYGDGAAWAANLLYGTGMSMADSLTANVLGGFSPIGGVIQGINAANSSLIDASERGVSAGKTLLTAAAAGTFEGLFENWSLGKLRRMRPEMNNTLKAVGKNVLKQMGTEGSEEAATEIANITFDTLLNGDESGAALKREAYTKQGMSHAEATSQVIWDTVRQVAEAGIGGALSGVGFGAGGAFANYATHNGQVRQIGHAALQSGQYDARLRTAMQFDPSSQIGRAAIKMANKDNVRSKDAGRFALQYDKAASNAIQSASNEQEVQDAYSEFLSKEDSQGAAALSKMADERIRALALQKAEVESAQESPRTATTAPVEATRVEASKEQIAPRIDATVIETQEGNTPRAIREYTTRDGTAWRGESSRSNAPEAEPEADAETRYNTTHLAKLAGSGEKVDVLDVASTDEGMVVRISGGKTAKLDDLQFDNSAERALYGMAKQFPTAKARAFVNNYNGSIGLENYTRAFNTLYDAGYKGKTNLAQAMRKFTGLPRETQSMLSFVYFAGENRAAAEAKAKQERRPAKQGTGRFVNKTEEKMDEAMQLLYMGAAAKTDMTVELQEQIQKDAAGAFDTGFSRIILSQNADNQIAALVHETAEYAREYNPEGMLDVQESMLAWYAKTNGFETLAAMVEDYRQRYEGKLGEESAGEAMGEMTHDALSALLTDEAGARDFLNWLKEDSGKSTTQQKNIIQTIVDLFDRLLNKITAYLHEHNLPAAANAFAKGMDLEQMAALRQMFFGAADQARINYNKEHQTSQRAEQGRAQAEGFADIESAGVVSGYVETEEGNTVQAERIEKRTAGNGDPVSKSTKYMFAGEKAVIANRAALERAKAEKDSELQPGEMIRRSTGWHQGPDGKWRFEIDDSKARLGDENSGKLGEFLIHAELYEAYPELREVNVTAMEADTPLNRRGNYQNNKNTIRYNPNLSSKERMKVILHEIQHVVQKTEGFGSGGNRDVAEAYLFNQAYGYAKALTSYKNMKTPEQREQFVKDVVAVQSQSGKYETAITEAYQNLFGEIEARNTANRYPLDQRGRRLSSPTNPKDSIVVDKNELAKQYAINIAEMKNNIDSLERAPYNQNKGDDLRDKKRSTKYHVERDVEGGRRGMDTPASSEGGKLDGHKQTLRAESGAGTESRGRGGEIYDGEQGVSGGTRFLDKDVQTGVDHDRLDEGTPGYAELLSKWGAIKPGYKPYREIRVPKKTSEAKKVRQFVRSVLESNAVTDEMAKDLKGEIVKETMSYTPMSDKQAQDTAKKLLKSGMDKAWRRWNAIVDGDSMPQKNDIVLGEYLLRTAAENGDKTEVVRLTAEISELGTRAGQSVQALSMLKKMTGIGQLVYVQRTVDTLNKDLIRRFKGKAFAEVKINEKLAEDLANAKTPEEVDAAAMEIYKDVADQLPPTWIDKWNAWRYLSMLGNPKTHIRNILGNAVFAPVVRLKDAIGAGIEAVAIKDRDRTKAVVVKKEYKEFAKQDFDQMQDIIKSGGKMNPVDVIRDQRTIFKNKTLERMRKRNFELMELEDGWFLKNHYQAALAQYLQANKAIPSAISEAQLDKARVYAVEQAQRATFRDASPVASAIQRASNTNKALNVIVEGVLPFKKTPINVLKRGVEYSPAGLLYTLSRGSTQLKRREITASQYIDGLASGLTGTGLAALGALLCSMGWVSGGFGDDKEDKFSKLQGQQEYALRIGDFTYTVDWMAPSAIPFFIGVELMAALQGEYEDAPSRAIIDALTNIAEPMFNLSMLDSLNNTINAVSFADNKLTAMIQEIMTSYFMQAIPSISGQISRTADSTRRRTYIDKNNWIPESMQRAYQKLFNKIPTLSYLNQPYIDEWGREDKTQNIAVRVFENFLSPGWFSEVRTSDMEQELQRLYEATGENGVLPGYAAKHITVDGKKINLAGDEYTLFASVRGMTAYRTIGEIVTSEEYADMSDAQKVKAIKDAFEFAGAAAKAAVSEYELESWQQDANEESQEEGVSIGEAIAHRAATNGAAPEIASVLQDEGAEAAQEKLNRMMKACASRDEMKDQKGNVKSAITRAYKKQYIKCHDARDIEGMRKIRQELIGLRTPVGKLYTMKDFRNWIK